MVRIMALAVLLAAGPALAHGWYDSACCDDHDCEKVPEDVSIREVEGGFAVGPTFVPKENVKISHDGDYHWCRYRSPGVARPILRCLYVPMPM